MEDFVFLTDLIGITAGILVLSSFIPQLHKAYKTKRMLDVSIYLMALIASGMFLWVIYGNKEGSCNNWHECCGIYSEYYSHDIKIKV
jgi:uncharacterized protein with PQ loop repeat